MRSNESKGLVMTAKKSVIIISVLVALASIAGAGYLTRGSWMPLLPGVQTTEGGFKVFEKDGVKYKECYVCPMHPQVVKPAPGSCPICGMDLIKKEIPLEEETKAQEAEMPTGMKLPRETAAMGEGREKEFSELKSISLDPRERVLANVATSRVGYEDISMEVYTVGRVAVNEDAIEKAAAWFPGRIERMYVSYVGQTVKKGQRIMSVYSPELVSTQKEYLVARSAAARLEKSGFPEITEGTAGVVEAARTRMKLWGVTDSQIERLEKTGVPDGSVDVYSKVSGTVTMITAREGGYMMEGSELFTVADLGTVWVNAEVYEYEFSKVSVGAHVEITADAFPGHRFHGRVSFIDPVVDNQSRTVRVRAVIKNPSGMLKPEMFVNSLITGTSRRALTVPASAVLYTGRREIVWVESGPGEYEPRVVELGSRSGDRFEVMAGLSEGDMAVSQGGFLIDSEAQLRMSAGGGVHAGHAGMDMGGGQEKAGEKMDTGGQAGHQH